MCCTYIPSAVNLNHYWGHRAFQKNLLFLYVWMSGIHEHLLFLWLLCIRFSVVALLLTGSLFLCACVQFGARFHTRLSVLQYGHLTNRRDLPTGIADALSYTDEHPYSERAVGSAVDPWWCSQDICLILENYKIEAVLLGILIDIFVWPVCVYLWMVVCMCVSLWFGLALQVNEISRLHDLAAFVVLRQHLLKMLAECLLHVF